MDRIVEIQLDSLRRLVSDRKVTLEIDLESQQWLARTGYDSVYGARTAA